MIRTYSFVFGDLKKLKNLDLQFKPLAKTTFSNGVPLEISACQIICAPNGLSSPKKPLGQNLRKLNRAAAA